MLVENRVANRNPGQVIDWDVALNNSSGGIGEDNAFNLCSTSAGGGGFDISGSRDLDPSERLS